MNFGINFTLPASCTIHLLSRPYRGTRNPSAIASIRAQSNRRTTLVMTSFLLFFGLTAPCLSLQTLF